MREKIKLLLHQATSSLNIECILNHPKNVDEELILILEICFHSTKNSSVNDDQLTLIDGVIDRLWEKLNTGRWQDVPTNLRDYYGYSSYVKACILLKFALSQKDDDIAETLTKALEAVDMGLLLGSSLREELTQTATSLCHLIYFGEKNPVKFTEFSQLKKNYDNHIKIIGKPVPVAVRPSIESFLTNYFTPRVPVKLKGCIDHWPALKNWMNVEYVFSKIGPRTVPVEIGSSYASSNWSQKLMTVRKFIEQFMLTDNDEVGYLAQHQLFNQIPELLNDIREPEYCVLSENYDNDSDDSRPDVNAWFGPCGTISPLHYDPKHNLLTQVVGSKKIFLIDPKWSENLYPYNDHLLHNTAQVNPEVPNYEDFPNFKNTELLECCLEPGEILYIPPKWWHQVRSLSASFSVSFWWGKT